MADKITEAQLFINGEFTDAVSGETFSSTNPATGQEWARVAKGDREDAIRAINLPDGELEHLSSASQQRVLAEHTAANRAAELLDLIESTP